MRRLLTLVIASLTAISLTGCIIVPRHGGGYYNGHDHGYHDRGDRGGHGDRGR